MRERDGGEVVPAEPVTGNANPSLATDGSGSGARTARRPRAKASAAAIAPPYAANIPIDPVPLIESWCPQNTGRATRNPTSRNAAPTISAVASNTASEVAGPRT
ncbi:hypothetical protein [uncultured Microbacterium sp.]|uniref:hypothetical protein n=1 Tax=uncultured Microbacterium sp. TaxID=191216 RepID=UPI0028E7CDA9|nr:hypothetical protein [uncultured Microbacterium sp.]